MAVYSPVRGGSGALKNCRTHLILAVRRLANVANNVEDSADERRLSNAGLDRSEYNNEGVNWITDISDENDTESTCEN